ncbi:Hypothetical predicted protein [Pelobates cultripes]|uniref:Uncharacterized protein n=1 Tax=Pelobates cultripes TaxID=61616 RepID=A0AAD1S221_PELCU|nr:Hypothetical predicted protein [Pelobates cultripes]CAH2285658.1 Hypothetical predicted protein [Pelobates cultripes]
MASGMPGVTPSGSSSAKMAGSTPSRNRRKSPRSWTSWTYRNYPTQRTQGPTRLTNDRWPATCPPDPVNACTGMRLSTSRKTHRTERKHERSSGLRPPTPMPSDETPVGTP